MKNLYFILDKDRNAVPVEDVLDWAKWKTDNPALSNVAYDKRGDVEVSTIFLGTNHNWRTGPPILFETMVFGGDNDGLQVRYETWNQAEAGHLRICETVWILDAEIING